MQIKIVASGDSIERQDLDGLFEVGDASDVRFAGREDLSEFLDDLSAVLGTGVVGKERSSGERHGGLRLIEQLLKGVGALGLKKAVRVLLSRQGGKVELEANAKGEREHPEGRFLAGLVAIEHNGELSRKRAEEGELFGRDARALWGDRLTDAFVPTANRIELAFDHDEALGFSHCFAGSLEIEKDVALAEKWRSGRIDVLGLVGGVIFRGKLKLPSGKGDDLSLAVADRNHQATSEARTELEWVGVVVARVKKAAVAERFFGEAFANEALVELLRFDWGKADLEFLRQIEGESPLFRPVGAAFCGLGVVCEKGLVVVVGGVFVELEELALEGAFFGFWARPLLVFEGLIEALSEQLHRFDERYMLKLLNKLEDVAGKAGTEAFENPPFGENVERGSLLVLKWTESDPVPTGSLELHLARYDIINIDVQL